MAMDAQGPQKACPYVASAGATFTTVVDAENVLGRIFGFRAIPNGILVDEGGAIRYWKFGGFDIRKAEYAEIVTRFAQGEPLKPEAQDVKPSGNLQVLELFKCGVALYHEGRTQKALSLWRQAMAIEPDNYVVRKQIWAVENPERFYGEQIDSEWQKEQLKRGL